MITNSVLTVWTWKSVVEFNPPPTLTGEGDDDCLLLVLICIGVSSNCLTCTSLTNCNCCGISLSARSTALDAPLICLVLFKIGVLGLNLAGSSIFSCLKVLLCCSTSEVV